MCAPTADAEAQYRVPGQVVNPSGGYQRHGQWGFRGTHLEGRRGLGK
jgi:hypothetical protein